MSCIICQTRKGKFSCGCLCQDATIHKHCIWRLASKLYEQKTDKCHVCNAKFLCVKPHHFVWATRQQLKERLQYTGISFGKTGMVPSIYAGSSEETKNQLRHVWNKAIDEELADSPDFVEKTLLNAKKRKFSTFYRGSKMD